MTQVVEIVPGLSPSEQARLAELEEIIERDLLTFVDVGLALASVKAEGLYRDANPPTWDAYCQQRWDYRMRHANQLIQSARVATAVGAMAPIPIPSERVARELVPFLGPEGEGADVVADLWSRVVATVDDRPPTARDVRAVLIAEGVVIDDRARASSGKTNRYILLGNVGDRLLKARDRFYRFVTRELGDEPPSDAMRKRANEYAEWCDDMADALRGIANR